MIASLTAALTLALAAGQAPGGAPKTGSAMVDPRLPPELREAVVEASRAELDPKRGPANAVELLRAKKDAVSSRPELALALDLRIAATRLRERFLGSKEFSPTQRAEQALSTFARLDLAEPGAELWLKRALDANPEAKRALAKPGAWRLKAAVLTRTASLERAAAERVFSAALASAGLKLEFVPAKEAEVVLVLGAKDAPAAPGRARAVEVTLGVELVAGGKLVWKNGLFRVESADDPAVALQSALEWLARIGGRDLYYRWLGAKGLATLSDPNPHRPGDGHDHAPAPRKRP